MVLERNLNYNSNAMYLNLVAASPIAITISQSKFSAFLKPSRTSSSEAPRVPVFSKSSTWFKKILSFSLGLALNFSKAIF